jgi:tetratricopeptide (TPR) repeat protein
VRIKLTPQEQLRLARVRPVNVEAHEALLKGEFHLNKLTDEGFQKAVQYFQQSIALDPTYARAHAALARVWIMDAVYGGVTPPRETMPKIQSAIANALGLEDGLAEAYVVRGLFKRSLEWDWPGAEKDIQRGIELNPNSDYAHGICAEHLTTMGRFEEALEENKRAYVLHPLLRGHFAWIYFYARRYDDAIRESQAALDITTAPHVADPFLAFFYYFKGMHAKALAECDNLGGARAQPVAASACGHIYGALGRRRKAQEALDVLYGRPYADSFFIAVIYAGMGEKEKAIDSLWKGYEERNGSMWAINVFPGFDNLRSGPRFQELLRRMNFPP